MRVGRRWQVAAGPAYSATGGSGEGQEEASAEGGGEGEKEKVAAVLAAGTTKVRAVDAMGATAAAPPVIRYIVAFVTTFRIK